MKPKYRVKQLLITERPVAIHIEPYKGEVVDDTAEYPKGEVFEILEVFEKEDGHSYRIDFGIDKGEIDYEFEEWQIDDFLQKQEEELCGR